MMNRFALAAISLVAAVPALGADLQVKARPMAPVVTAYNWSGCYIGGNVGGKWADTTQTVATGIAPAVAPFPAQPAAAISFRDRSDGTVIGGGQIGCNWQAPGSNWVFGVEGDADAQRLRQTRVLVGVTPLPLLADDAFGISSDWQASARGRIGYAWDRWMLYATGGAAFTDLRTNALFVAAGGIPTISATDRKTIVGATVGGGFEYAFTNNWSLGVEGRYSWYGNQTLSAGTVTIGPPPLQFAPATQTVRLETLEVTARLNWKFDWTGPVVARY